MLKRWENCWKGRNYHANYMQKCWGNRFAKKAGLNSGQSSEVSLFHWWWCLKFLDCCYIWKQVKLVKYILNWPFVFEMDGANHRMANFLVHQKPAKPKFALTRPRFQGFPLLSLLNAFGQSQELILYFYFWLILLNVVAEMKSCRLSD